MTSAERAKEVKSYLWAQLNGGSLDLDTVESLITTAITQAQNDKLEEAATAYDEVHAERGLGARGQPNLFSTWLRRWAQYQSLKSKDTP